MAHRVAWLHYYGVWPKSILDHKDTDKSNNSIANLREATFSTNTMNSKLRSDNHARIKGVRFIKRLGKWQARIGLNGTNFHLGVFATVNEALEARHAALIEKHAEFARAG